MSHCRGALVLILHFYMYIASTTLASNFSLCQFYILSNNNNLSCLRHYVYTQMFLCTQAFMTIATISMFLLKSLTCSQKDISPEQEIESFYCHTLNQEIFVNLTETLQLCCHNALLISCSANQNMNVNLSFKQSKHNVNFMLS